MRERRLSKTKVSEEVGGNKGKGTNTKYGLGKGKFFF